MSAQRNKVRAEFRVALALGVFLGLSLVSSVRLFGQGLGPNTVTVVLVDELPEAKFGAMIQRTGGANSRDIILLDQRSSVADLAAALAVVRSIASKPDPRMSESMGISRTDGAKVRNNSARERLQRDLSALYTAPRRHVDGVGSVRAIEVAIPATPRRSKV
jgi:hypothetical protein